MKKENWGMWNRKIDAHKDKIIELYKENSIRQVAEIYGVSHHVISRRLDYWGVEKRNRADEATRRISQNEIRKKISIANFGENNPMYGKKRPDHSKRMLGKNNPNYGNGDKIRGKNNPMYGRSVYSVWLEKYGKKEADKRQIEADKKRRLSAIKRKQIIPNHNPVGCEIIRWFNMYYDFNFQHAENGGEVCIDGYFPDGVDQEKMTIIEIDEPHHFNGDGTYKEKDIQRQKYLEGLGYKFIRVRI